jgi:hypothetical protein
MLEQLGYASLGTVLELCWTSAGGPGLGKS